MLSGGGPVQNTRLFLWRGVAGGFAELGRVDVGCRNEHRRTFSLTARDLMLELFALILNEPAISGVGLDAVLRQKHRRGGWRLAGGLDEWRHGCEIRVAIVMNAPIRCRVIDVEILAESWVYGGRRRGVAHLFLKPGVAAKAVFYVFCFLLGERVGTRCHCAMSGHCVIWFCGDFWDVSQWCANAVSAGGGRASVQSVSHAGQVSESSNTTDD